MRLTRPHGLSAVAGAILLGLIIVYTVRPQSASHDRDDTISSMSTDQCSLAADQPASARKQAAVGQPRGEPTPAPPRAAPTLSPPQDALTMALRPDAGLAPRGQVIYVQVEAEADGAMRPQ